MELSNILTKIDIRKELCIRRDSKRRNDIALLRNLSKIQSAHKSKWYMAHAKHLIKRAILLRRSAKLNESYKRCMILYDITAELGFLPKIEPQYHVYMIRKSKGVIA